MTLRNVEECTIKGYLQRMDALKLCGVELPENFQRHDATGRFVPVRLIESDVDKMGGEMACCIAPGGENFDHPFESLYDIASYAITETANNARQHSGGLGYASAQVVRTDGMVRVAISDNGRGILRSFKDADFEWSHGMDDTQAILKALEPRISSRGKPVNEGVGLTLVSELARLMGGWLLIVSGTGVVRMSKGGKLFSHKLPGNAYHQGTLVALAFEASVKDYTGLLQAAKVHAGLLPSGGFRVKFE